MRTPSIGSCSRKSNYSRTSVEIPDNYGVGGAMLPVFLHDLGANDHHDLVEVTLELEPDNSVVLRSVAPASTTGNSPIATDSNLVTEFLTRSLSATSKLRRKFSWIRSPSTRTTNSESSEVEGPTLAISARDARRLTAQLQRTRSSAQQALKGLRFISKTTIAGASSDANQLWKKVESRFSALAKDGLLCRQDFGECIGMHDSREFAVRIFDALARRKRQRLQRITKDELYDFWLQLSDQSFDARLQIFFDMADSNEDGRITRDEIQELIMLSASANKLSQLKEQAEEYATLIMEELDPENLGYIELWQLETLLLQRDGYMDYSKPLSMTSVGKSHNTSSFMPNNLLRKMIFAIRCSIMENWQRTWILVLWVLVMAALFSWKFYQYKNKAAFKIMGYCLATAKGAAETIKLNMALILLPVCRNTITWLRSTRARLFVPFDDNINFHKVVACAIAVGVILHAGNHLACDFPRLVHSSPEEFAPLASMFNNKKPSYGDLLTSIAGVTGIIMVVFLVIAYTLATNRFRRNVVKLPSPLNRVAGFNAFWYAHHLTGLVYVLLFIHGSFLFLVQKWYQKTTWMYISAPLLLYTAERSLRTCRSEYFSVKTMKVLVLPGNVLRLVMSKPQGFKYESGQYIFLQCAAISPFEWHPFSLTSAPGDNYLSVHIRMVGDWTRELKKVFTESRNSLPERAKFGQVAKYDQDGVPKLFVDGPYGAPAQEYKNYDVLLLVGLGIGATPFISIITDLLNNARADEQMNPSIDGKKKSLKTTRAHFYWITREPGSFEWFKGVMDEIAEMDLKGQIEMHNYLTSVYEEGDARSTLITMVQALNHAKNGVDILSGTRVRTHFARPNWREVFIKIASKYQFATVGVFYCGMPVLAKELRSLSQEMSHKTTTRFEFHKEYF
ncbi:hypothetical protein QQ045_032502 [Rhodiola kirilowii]